MQGVSTITVGTGVIVLKFNGRIKTGDCLIDLFLIQQSQARFASLVKHSSDLVMVIEADTEIKYASFGTITNNPTGLCFAECFDAGVKAYFAWRNDQGGIYGRKLVLSSGLFEVPDTAPRQPPQPGKPWKNSLDMRYVPVGADGFATTETRVRDYQAFNDAVRYDLTGGMISLG